jgi:hypothetical protein
MQKKLEEEQKPDPELFKMRRFQSVESKIGKQLDLNSHRNQPSQQPNQ